MITFRQTVLFIGSILLVPLSSNIFANAQVVTNIAKDKTATQSSTHYPPGGVYTAEAGKAVDGIKNDYDNFSSTSSGGPQWWEVELGAGTFVIKEIKIYNRHTGAAMRINGAVVKILEAGNTTPTWTSDKLLNSLDIFTLQVPENTTGNKVRIELSTGTFLNMREVEVMGYEDTSLTNSNAGGDPHFKTFQDIFFSYHAACDILLLNSIIHEVMVQIRTTRVDTHRRHQSSYSYISQAAVKIQDVILEVSADGILLINGEDSSDRVPASIADGYAGLTKTIKGTKRNIISYKVDLGNGRSIDLRSNIKTGMMYVDVDGHFSDNKGLLGPSTGQDGLYARDGTIIDTAAEGAYNSYSQSWQVTSDEPMLFQEARFPQHPSGCSYTAVPATASSSSLRRRLTDVVEVSKEDAMKACADAVPGDKMDFCVTDVMLTGDLDAAEDEFYYLN